MNCLQTILIKKSIEHYIMLKILNVSLGKVGM